MLTAKGEESDIVVGLGVGADDYMAKPFSPRELVARVRACLRRGEATIEGRDRVISLPDLVIDPVRYRVTVQGRPVAVTLTEFRLLHFLAANPGRVFTRSELLPKVIGEGAFVVDRNIDVHVRNLRKKLGPKAACVETVRGVGYRFEG
jgi:DNA-binding response OmpR family regulator